MVQESVFRGVIDFMGQIGVYDIILPFLLVFTIVFAILEKTKILGIEKSGDKTFTKKNLNSMVAFVIGFLVIASTQLVSIISEVAANVVLLLLLAICFLLLVGVFHSDGEFSLTKDSGWVKFFMIFMFIGICLIFLNALDWLQPIIDWLVDARMDSQLTSTIVFVIIVVGFMWYVVKDPKSKNKDKKE